MGNLKAELVISTKEALQDIKKFRKEMEAILEKKVGAPSLRRIKERGDIEIRAAKKTSQERTKIDKKQETKQKSSASRITAFQRNLREGSRKLEQRHEKARLRAIATEQAATKRSDNIRRAALQRQQNVISKRTSKQTQSIFQVQQAIEDFSFAGFRGASNNIAFLASQFGGKGGLIALVALAGASIFTMTNRLTGNSKAAKDSAKANKELIDQLIRLRGLRQKGKISRLLDPLTTRPDILAAQISLNRKELEFKARKEFAREDELSPTQTAITLRELLKTDKERSKIQQQIRQQAGTDIGPGRERGDILRARLEEQNRKRDAAIRRATRQGVRVELGTGIFERFRGQRDTIQNTKEITSALDKFEEKARSNRDAVSVLRLEIAGLGGQLKNLKGPLEGITNIISVAGVKERFKGLSGFALQREQLSEKRQRTGRFIEKEQGKLRGAIIKAAGDEVKIRAAEKKSRTIIEGELDRLALFGEQEREDVKEEKRRRKFVRGRGGLSTLQGRFEAKSAGKIQLLQFEEREKKRALAEENRALTRKFQLGELTQKQFDDEAVSLNKKLVVILKVEDSLKKQLATQKKSAADAKKATQDAIRDAKRLDQQLAASKTGFATSLFGARLGFAAKVTGRQAENVKRQARLRGFGSGQDKNIDRFFGRVGLQRERGIVRGRLSQLTGEARAAGAAGNFQGQIGALKQRQQLEFQRSAQEQNLQTSFKFLQAAQKTQEEIERLFSRKGAGQIMMTAAQTMLQAAKIIAGVAGVGGAPGGGFGGTAIAGGGGAAGAGGRAGRIRTASELKRIVAQSDRLDARGQVQSRGDRININKANIMNVDLANEAKRGKAVEANAVRIRAADAAKRKRLQDIEAKQRFFENFNNNAASMLLTGMPQGRFRPNVNQQNQNISNIDNSGQVGNIVNHFNGNMNQDDINLGISISRQGATRGGPRRGRPTIREMQG